MTDSSKQSQSSIWDHFTQKDSKARCRYCLKDFAYGSGSTANLKRHIDRIHPTVPFGWKKPKNKEQTSSKVRPQAKITASLNVASSSVSTNSISKDTNIETCVQSQLLLKGR